ncbi:vWA domain-containing protein [Sinisalibacter aestuarii]|uniref:VWA domain-containing protein n=1 Tax=Sinisalibacter aestuarii TaxID=2949426 RepID=A0ABQ5LYD6_9RHOB|nr:VWA domain-containing protein [Sinisalibacter aestuarii]GKY89987.1 VWA domain-containing protein [Sinisalibacter aestuarii]
MASPRSDPTPGRLAENVTHFVHALRRAGVKVGSSQLHTALEAVQAAGFTRRDDFYWVLRATLITRPEQFETFHQVFRMFWRTPDYIEKMMEIMLPVLQTLAPDRGLPKAAERRAREALEESDGAGEPPAERQERQELEMDARLSWSQAEVIRAKDFEQMSAEEIARASTAIRSLALPAPPLRTRRMVAAAHGARPDMRAMLRRSLRRGGEVDRLMHHRPGTRPPGLVVLCDVSGSMSVYSRMMMHFLHALTWTPNSGWGRVHAFTFGTRLTNITRALAHKDVDEALEALGREVSDWEGGTRIGEALHSFNRDWSRRVLGQGAVVMLITDGLERGDPDQLGREAERLALSCRRLIWLNPLLRWEAFEPKAGGIRALLPHVDSFHACHSLDSIADLTRALATGGGMRPAR